jgi:hypothetical protein
MFAINLTKKLNFVETLKYLVIFGGLVVGIAIENPTKFFVIFSLEFGVL